MRKTKIVCTIGPASRDPLMIERLVAAGMDVARLNMSHGTHEEHAEVYHIIRDAAQKHGRAVAILMDLQGPKIRLGELPEPVIITAGEKITFTEANVAGRQGFLPVRYSYLGEELKPGDRFSMADGMILLEVLESMPDTVTARALSSGRVTSRKGVNLPTGGDALSALTEKDEVDLRFGLKLGVDMVALSFVRSPEDALRPRAIMNELDVHAPLLAKIEKPKAVAQLDGILAAFDGLMVARGDLGVEVPLEEVPGLQKMIIKKAVAAAKPVITATQMLLSMVSNPRPTRAEAADVANAVLDGSDALMMSEETAMGAHPLLALETMAQIALAAEKLHDHICHCEDGEHHHYDVSGAITRAAHRLADQIGARLIVTPTTSGNTARLVAATRPPVPILALSENNRTVHALCLSWGITPQQIGAENNADELFEICRREALASGLAQPGDRIVVTGGLPLNTAGTTNVLKVMEL